MTEIVENDDSYPVSDSVESEKSAPPEENMAEGVSSQSTKDEEQGVIYEHAEWPSNSKLCFICKSDNAEKGRLNKCQMTITEAPCPIRFHEKCIKEYNAGDYSYAFLRSKLKKQCCPLHHCSYCFQNRYKTTTTVFSTDNPRVTCIKCLQSFHQLCIPGGVTLTEKNLIAEDETSLSLTTECPNHTDFLHTKRFGDIRKKLAALANPSKSKKLHFNVCCECDSEEGEMLLCSKCIRSYHSKCHRFTKKIGLDGKESDAKTLCEVCILGDYVRHDSPAVALYNAKFWPCKIVSNDLYPRKTLGDPFKLGLELPGFVTVQWGGCNNTYAVLPHSYVCQLTHGSYEASGSHCTAEKYKQAWQDALKDCQPRKTPAPPSDYVEIKKSQYHPDCYPVYRHKYRSIFECDCVRDSNRCDPAKCDNSIHSRECPESCTITVDGVSRPCLNRTISEGRMIDGLEKRSAEGKGLGIFATTFIPKAACIGEYAGELINNAEKAKRVKKMQEEHNDDEHHYMMDLERNVTVDCRYKGNNARFLNHSCQPNCYVGTVDIVVGTSENDDSKYKVIKRCGIYALRNIREGEELTFDYQMEQHEGSSVPRCSCRSKNCTGFMRAKSSKFRSRSDSQSPKKRGKKRNTETNLAGRSNKKRKTSECQGAVASEDNEKENEIQEVLPKDGNTVEKPEIETEPAKDNFGFRKHPRRALSTPMAASEKTKKKELDEQEPKSDAV